MAHNNDKGKSIEHDYLIKIRIILKFLTIIKLVLSANTKESEGKYDILKYY